MKSRIKKATRKAVVEMERRFKKTRSAKRASLSPTQETPEDGKVFALQWVEALQKAFERCAQYTMSDYLRSTEIT